MIKQLLAAAAALTLAAPVAAQAQEVPSYAYSQADQQIQGRITAFDGAYNVRVRDDNGYVDNVELHDGTIINPTGLTLAPGMVVSILGENVGSAFDANEIDTPYNVENDVAYYSGHPWNYYGPSIDLSFFFGNTGWWHRPIAFAGRDRGVAYVGSTHVNRIVVNDYHTNVANETPQAPRRVPAPLPIPERPSAPVTHTSPYFRAVPVDRQAPRANPSAARGEQHPAAAPSRGSETREHR